MNVSLRGIPIFMFIMLPVGLIGADATSTTWKTSISAGARTSYDDNVFLQEHSAIIAPNAAPANAGSWVNSVSLALGATWQPTPALAVDAGYAPELTRYARFNSENHDDQRFSAGLHGKDGAWSYDAKGGLLVVDGSSDSPIFGHVGGTPAIGGEQVRSRRDQTATKGSANLTYTFNEKAFVRAVGAASFQDFLTNQKPTSGPGGVPGYTNYVDRSEWSVGTDAGWFIHKGFALVAGVRFGEQHQANLLGVRDNYSNSLTRFLVGVEGKVCPTLSVNLLAGPDVRRYTDSAAAGFDRTRTTRYAEGTATWTPFKSDAFSLSMKDYLWLSSGGRGAYENILYDLTWKHTFNKTWSTVAGFNYQEGDNLDYVAPASFRNDSIYTVSGGVAYAFNAKTKLDVSVTREWSDSAVANKPGREYVHWLVSAGVKYTF